MEGLGDTRQRLIKRQGLSQRFILGERATEKVLCVRRYPTRYDANDCELIVREARQAALCDRRVAVIRRSPPIGCCKEDRRACTVTIPLEDDKATVCLVPQFKHGTCLQDRRRNFAESKRGKKRERVPSRGEKGSVRRSRHCRHKCELNLDRGGDPWAAAVHDLGYEESAGAWCLLTNSVYLPRRDASRGPQTQTRRINLVGLKRRPG